VKPTRNARSSLGLQAALIVARLSVGCGPVSTPGGTSIMAPLSGNGRSLLQHEQSIRLADRWPLGGNGRSLLRRGQSIRLADRWPPGGNGRSLLQRGQSIVVG
jgi:hypothetical protein